MRIAFCHAFRCIHLVKHFQGRTMNCVPGKCGYTIKILNLLRTLLNPSFGVYYITFYSTSFPTTFCISSENTKELLKLSMAYEEHIVNPSIYHRVKKSEWLKWTGNILWFFEKSSAYHRYATIIDFSMKLMSSQSH